MYLLYKISISSEHVDMAQALLALDVDMDGVTYEDEGFSFYVPATQDQGAIATAITKINASFPLIYTTTELEDKNWNAQWESDFKSVEVRDYCRVRAPFHEPSDAFTHDIIINPGMAFGTGHHETTWQMIDALSRSDISGKKVLDAGCGTGVLAILAAKEGAGIIDSFDYDIHSVESSELNKGLNKVNHINVSKSDVSNYEGSEYDIIVANINRNVIISSMQSFKDKLTYKGMIIASGYLEVDLQLVQSSATAAGLTLLFTTQRGEWMCQVYQR